jgi:hypothetical protein
MPMPINIKGKIGGAATGANWFIKPGKGSGSISGSLTSGGNVTATYTAVAADLTRGYIELYLETNDPDGVGLGKPCLAKSDTVKIYLNKRPRIVPLTDQIVCEPALINLSGSLSGSATNGSWSAITTAGGTLSVSNVNGLGVVSATYDTLRPDVGSTLTFRLTTNDPDGSGPCAVATDDMTVQIYESAKVFAGLDFEVCEDSVFNLQGSYSGATATVGWTGGSGAGQFSNPSSPTSKYTLTPTDINNGFIVLTLTTNDPVGPCPIASDAVRVNINKLPDVFIFDLEDRYAENEGIVTLSPVPIGGTFTGPGIVAGTHQFNTANAGYGPITIRYDYTDAKGCSNFATANTVVNPVTDVDFYILEQIKLDADGNPEICADQGDVTLVGVPDVDTPHDEPTLFVAISDSLKPRLKLVGGKWRIDTNGLDAGTYIMQYIFTNTVLATDTVTKDIIVFAAPKSVITVENNCIEDQVQFQQASFIPDSLNDPSSKIIRWVWQYGEEGNGGVTTVEANQPQYNYLTPGNKNVTLMVETNKGCTNTSNKTIVIGTPPTADFDWAAFCQGDVTKFFDKSISEFGTVNYFAWDFGNGDTLGLSSNKPVPPGHHGGATTGTYKNPKHKYVNFQQYDVTHTVGTTAGCTATKTRTIFILQTPVSNDSYFTDFESGPGTWVAVGEDDTPSSWIFGAPDGDVIKSPGDNAWWTGGNGKSYYNNEQSFVIGPCLNLSSIQRPMVSLNYQVDSKEGFDGAVLQFSTDGGINWETVGDANTNRGINWYNRFDVIGSPGGDDNYAWSKVNQTEWKNARFNLDQIPVTERDTVVFRIAFGSSLDPAPGRPLNGFAFDDVYIGEKRRNVLVEHFTNDNIVASDAIDDQLDNVLASPNFIKLQYHLSTDQTDPLHTDNPLDNSSRALLYRVSTPPVTLMDGIYGDYFGTNFHGFWGDITPEVLDRRSLEAPSFDISVAFRDTVDQALAIDITYTYIDSVKAFDRPIILQAALVESGDIGIDPDGNKNVLRKLLLGREGVIINDDLTPGTPATYVQHVKVPLDVNIVDGDSLWVIAFAQESSTGDSKTVLQSAIVKAPKKERKPPVGIENPVIAEVNSISIYPNPASQEVKLKLGGKLSRGYGYKMIDQRGVTVLEGEVKRDLTNAQEIDISKLANGIYFMAIHGDGKVIRYEKVVVLNHH